MPLEVRMLTIRCSSCGLIEANNGDVIIATPEQRKIMDELQAEFLARGWQMGARCPNCKVS